MDRKEYILRLTQSLSRYEVEDEFTFISNYDELIEEILFDNDQNFNAVIEKLGYPEILAQELAQEFNFKLREDVPNYKYKYKPRKRSNTIWRILKIIAWVVQIGFILSLVTLLSISMLASRYSHIIVKSDVQQMRLDTDCEMGDRDCMMGIGWYSSKSMIAVCNIDDTDCIGFIIDESRVRDTVTYCQGSDCMNEQGMPNQYVLPLQFILIVSSVVTGILLLANQLLIIRNINKVIRSNNDYNRRRNDE